MIKLDLEFYRREPINNRKIAGWLPSVEYNPIEAQLRKTNQYTYCISPFKQTFYPNISLYTIMGSVSTNFASALPFLVINDAIN